MIEFTLQCANAHRFNGWFKSNSACEEQLADNRLACPECGDKHVSKSLSAPYIGNNAGKRRGANPIPAPVKSTNPPIVSKPIPAPSQKEAFAISPEEAETFRKIYTMAKKVREHVEKNCDDVGKEFAEEARKIHYGETEPRGIYGQVTKEDAEELIEEGIEVAPLPDLPKADS